MVLLTSFVLALVAPLTLASDSAVIDLIPSNFDKFALSGKPALVEFFAPWCGHCKSLAPVYEELAKGFEFAKDKLTIAKVDADSEKSLGKRFGIQGFPTIKYFDGKSETPEEYNGGRDLESLSAFLVDKTGIKAKKAKVAPSAVEILTEATFSKTIGRDNNVLVAFTAPWCGHCKSLAPTWEQLAQDYAREPNVIIAKVDAEAPNSKAIAKEQGVSSYPTIKFFAKGSKEAEDYSGGRSEREFLAFVNEKAGTNRVAGGGLNAVAGTVKALDDVVAKYISGMPIAEIEAEVTASAKAIKESAQNTYAKYYVRVFEKLGESDTFVVKELARLEGIIKKGGLAPAKLDEFTSKTNILRKFMQKAIGHEEL